MPGKSVFFLGAAFACVGIPSVFARDEVDAPNPKSVTVHTERRMQVLRGFGASGGWWAQEVGKWPQPTRRAILELLFDRTIGIGLTQYRHNLGAGSENDGTIADPLHRTESFLAPDGKYDWNRDAAAMRILREACALGAEQVTLFAISPPVSLTRNGHAYGDRRPANRPETNLKPGREREFARYLCTVARHLIADEHLPIESLSPLNEPEWGWDTPQQEGCHYSPGEAVALLKATLAEERIGGLRLRIEAPENGSWKTARAYEQALADDPELRGALPAICLHSYFSQVPDKRDARSFLDREWPEVRLRMTEWCELKSGLDPTMKSALVLARTVIEDLVVARVESWAFWLAASPHDYRDGLVQLDPSRRSFYATRRLWVLGQFSRFLRPGFRLLEIENTASPAQLLAAESPDRLSIVIVAMNPGPGEERLRLTFSDGAVRRIGKAVITDATRALAEGASPADYRTMSLPAESVSTFVFARSGPRVAPEEKPPIQ